MGRQGKLAILVGGGPAPGINSVIAAATIRGRLAGIEVLGIMDGFEDMMHKRNPRIEPLTIERVSRAHFLGGSVLGTSRANPTKSEEYLKNVVRSLLGLGVTKLITIGGDDTAFSSMKVDAAAGDWLSTCHVPKTIDNDLDLPRSIDTFGFQTARHLGAELVENLMTDARTTSRWYFVIAMGRKAGHLALGIGKAAGATLTMIPEEWPKKGYIPLRWVVDTLACAIMKRKSEGRSDGVAVIAEGMVERIDPKELEGLEDIERDAHGHIRIAEINVGEFLKKAVRRRLAEFDLSATIVEKNIGYELRCAAPIPYDMQYCRDLGYCAAKYLISGGHAVMATMQGGNFVPIPFEKMLDPETGRPKVRMVDIYSTRYAIARRYMIRLRRDDFEAGGYYARIAATAGLTPEQFEQEFHYLTEYEPPPLVLNDPEGKPLVDETEQY